MLYTAGEILVWILLGALLSGIVLYRLGRARGASVAEHEMVTSERASFAAKASSLEKDRDEYVSAHAKLRDDLERTKAEVAERDAEIAERDAQIAELMTGRDAADEQSTRIAELAAELEACRSARSELEADIETARMVVTDAETRIAALTPSPTGPEMDLDAAAAIIGRRVQLDDLRLIEGIGPKIAKVCTAAGITTWRQLSMTPVDRLREILAEAGERFRLHDPGTWPSQARLLADGEWQEFKLLVAHLAAGRSSRS
jgi:predicted flap endonuclease-1-like 5' DNA nuclease